MQLTDDTIIFEDVTAKQIRNAVNLLARVCHGRSVAGGWWHDIKTGEKLNRNVPEMLCLIHSEISEAMEGYRKKLKDDKLPEYDMIAVELCDALIREFDLLPGLGHTDPGSIFVKKIFYNMHRADHKPENRLKEGGKAF